VSFDEDKQRLLTMLHLAFDIELSTIPPYLVALLSIHEDTNRDAAEVIRSVMTEEMLHMLLVANVVSSLGGTVRLNKSTVPSYPLNLTFEGRPFADRQFDVNLERFSVETIRTFLRIEQPRVIPPARRAEIIADAISIPKPTIGDFYTDIIDLIEDLADADCKRLFTGDPSRQPGVGYYWSAGGSPVVVSDLASAKVALSTVVHQGEGAGMSLDDGDAPDFGQPYEVAHYFRFRQIQAGRRYGPTDSADQLPSGPDMSVDYTRVHPIIVNPTSASYAAGTTLQVLNDTFNARYTRMLIDLAEGLNGHPKTLYTSIMNGMHGLAPLARRMMATPIDNDPDERTGCPTFEWQT
jgi:Ferritin-like